jgi:menaquinone-dependent protoporphyrinogen oxidase
MKRISKKRGLPTDTSRDYEFTDWAAVDRFAGELGGILAQSMEVAPRSAIALLRRPRPTTERTVP